MGYYTVECAAGDDARCSVRLRLDREVTWLLSVRACEGTEEIPDAPGLFRCIENPVNYRSSAEATLAVPAILTPTPIPSAQPAGN